MSAPRLTPWFPPTVNPSRPGLYRAQEMGMRCNCCWIDLEFRGGEWFSTQCSPGYFRTHFFTRNLRHWRGLASEPKAKP